MTPFQITEVRIGTAPGCNADWNKAEIVFKGENEVFPGIIREIVAQKRIRFPEKELSHFFETSSFSQRNIGVVGRSVTLSFHVYGGKEITIARLRDFGGAYFLPELCSTYNAVEEIRKTLLVLKAAEEVRA